MAKKLDEKALQKHKQRVQAVLDLLKKQAPLTLKQEKFCNNACVERFLKAKGDSAKKAAKHLRNCLSWRDSLGTGFFRSASAFMNMLLAALKIVGDYYPGQLHWAFIIDPPSLFSYLWKGVKPFVELSSSTMVVSSLDFEESLHFKDLTSYPRATSLRFDPSTVPSVAKLGSCSSSRFAFTVSHHFDSLKPWYLSLTDTSEPKPDFTNPSHAFLGPRISPLNARSLSFASPLARPRPRGNIDVIRKGFFPSTPMPQKTQKLDPSMIHRPRTPKPSFFQSPALFFHKKECQMSRIEKSRESFVPYFKFYERPYDEMVYRSKMRPPLGGLISIVSPQLKRRHMSVSQRF